MSKFSRILGSIVRYLVATVSLSVVLYILFALIFSTEEERRLQRENNLYKSMYRDIRNKDRLIGDVVDGLLVKDDAIYRQLFETTPPSLDAITAADLIADSDSLSESFYLSAAASASERLMMMSGTVDDNFAEVFRVLLKGRRDSIPPLCLPLKGMSYVQTGASVGPKHNPVYKLEMQHDGIDFIAPRAPRSMPPLRELSPRSPIPGRALATLLRSITATAMCHATASLETSTSLRR